MDGKESTGNKNTVLVILGIICVASYFVSNQYIKFIIVAAVFYSAFLIDSIVPTFLYLAVSVAIDISLGSYISMLAVMPAYINRYTFKARITTDDLMFGPLFITAIISYMLGNSPNIRTMILFLLAVCVFVSIRNFRLTFEDIKGYVYVAFLVICFILLIQAANGGVQIKLGRLALDDNIREVADVISIPAVLSLMSLFRSEKKSVLDVSVAVISGMVLLATLSRGALIAVAFSFLIYLILSKKISLKQILWLCLLAIIVYLGYRYLNNLGILRLERLFESTDGLNGRTDIWSQYWTAMKQDISSVLFGFGPGDVRRLGISTYYSHSVFLDVLFSYGVVGFVLFLVPFSICFFRMLRAEEKEGVCFAIFAILLYLTHGVATTFNFYIMLGMAYSISASGEEIVAEYDEGTYSG